jgi:hypothetical protein
MFAKLAGLEEDCKQATAVLDWLRNIELAKLRITVRVWSSCTIACHFKGMVNPQLNSVQ